jgi:hypothetical protein
LRFILDNSSSMFDAILHPSPFIFPVSPVTLLFSSFISLRSYFIFHLSSLASPISYFISHISRGMFVIILYLSSFLFLMSHVLCLVISLWSLISDVSLLTSHFSFMNDDFWYPLITSPSFLSHQSFPFLSGSSLPPSSFITHTSYIIHHTQNIIHET